MNQSETFCRNAVDVIEARELAQRLAAAAAKGTALRVKFGMDPSSPDLHVGHSIPLLKLRAIQELGHTIVLIVGDDLSRYPSLRQMVHRHKLDKAVRFLGFQPASTISSFYRLARVFVFPSLYEGFGLPPLEAMACGTPVVTSNVSSLPEVAGDAALLVDPTNVDEIADAIRRAATDEALRQTLIARGLVRARQFSWSESVAQTHRVYMDVLRGWS